ncbi:MAG: NAD-dependent epimerase/dehydratase family protein, partial [archaeon]
MKRVLVTGSGGLIGSEAVRFFAKNDFEVVGIDNDMRAKFFGEEASTSWNVGLLKKEFPDYKHISMDIRDEKEIPKLFMKNRFELVIHCAAQPSHDWAAKEPKTDFTINANGT